MLDRFAFVTGRPMKEQLHERPMALCTASLTNAGVGIELCLCTRRQEARHHQSGK